MKKVYRKVLGFVKKYPIFCGAILFWICTHAVDIISTEVVMAFLKGSAEANPYARDPQTFKFLVGKALQMDSVYFFECMFVAVFGLAIKSDMFAAVAFLYEGYGALDAAFHNMILWWKGF